MVLKLKVKFFSFYLQKVRWWYCVVFFFFFCFLRGFFWQRSSRVTSIRWSFLFLRFFELLLLFQLSVNIPFTFVAPSCMIFICWINCLVDPAFGLWDATWWKGWHVVIAVERNMVRSHICCCCNDDPWRNDWYGISYCRWSLRSCMVQRRSWVS